MHYGTGSITNPGAKIWELVPQNIKDENTSLFLKARLRNGYQKITLVIFVRPSWIYLSFLLNPIMPG